MSIPSDRADERADRELELERRDGEESFTICPDCGEDLQWHRCSPEGQ